MLHLRRNPWLARCLISALFMTAILCGCAASKGSNMSEKSDTSDISDTDNQQNESDKSDQNNITDASDQQMNPEELEHLSVKYSYLLESTITLDSNGNLVDPTVAEYKKISDILTGETAYYSAERQEYCKTDDNISTRYYSQLYDTDGNLVKDWEELRYNDCMGDWILAYHYVSYEIESEDNKTSSMLINVKTGETKEDVTDLLKRDDNSAIIHIGNNNNYLVIDSQGKEIKAYDLPDSDIIDVYPVLTVKYGMIFYENNEKVTIYDLEGQEKGWINAYYYDTLNILAPYINCEDKIYDPTSCDGGEAEPIFQGNQIYYYDGELAICTLDDKDRISYGLYDVKKNVLISDTYDDICYDRGNEPGILKQKSDYFVACKGNQLYKLDREGKVIQELTMDETIGGILWSSEGIICSLDNYDKSCLLDSDLNTRIPVGTYNGISVACDSDYKEVAGLLKCEHLGDYNWKYDLLTSDGKVILKDASYISEIEDQKMLVIRGLSMGIMDTEGNWIKKFPKHELENTD